VHVKPPVGVSQLTKHVGRPVARVIVHGNDPQVGDGLSEQRPDRFTDVRLALEGRSGEYDAWPHDGEA
jgi:carbamate kinase